MFKMKALESGNPSIWKTINSIPISMWIDSELTHTTMEFLQPQQEDQSAECHRWMPHTSHVNVFAEAISISFTTDFATRPIESTEEETIQPLHSSTPQPSLQTTNDSIEGSSSSYMTADTVTQISDVTVQGNMIHAPKQFFLQLLSQNHRLAQSKFSLKCKLW